MKMKPMTIAFALSVLSYGAFLKNLEARILVPKSAVEIQVSKELQNKVLGVRIDDLIKSSPETFRSVGRLNEYLKKNIANHLSRTDVEVIHTIYLPEFPKTLDGTSYVKVIAFVEYKNKKYAFETIESSFATQKNELVNLVIENTKTLDLMQTDFQVETALVDRKVIIKDEKNDLKIVFPIGVGSFDEGVLNEGVTSLITPRFNNGFIPKSSIISKREMPRYFKGKPFIRIHDGEKRTEIGFHIEINDYFNRGFDSHGCMRLREEDLQAFHDLLVHGPKSQTPVVVKYRLQDDADHPASLNNKYFKTVVNKGSKDDPFFILDRDNLVQLGYRDNVAPPMDQLFDDENDNYYELLSYSTEAQLKEQNERRAKQCRLKVEMKEIKEKDFDKCMDDGKRKGSVGDWIYRKWVHG